MKLIFRYLKKYKLLFLLDFVSVFGFALAELGIPTLISQMIDQGVDAGDPQVLFGKFWTIIFISVLGTCGTLCLAFTSTRLSTNITYDIRRDLFNHIMTLSHEQMEHFGVSSLITRTGSDPYQIMLFLNSILRSALMTPVMIIISIILVVKTSLNLAWIVISTIPIVIIGVIIIFKFAGPLSERQQKSLDHINEILRDNMSGIRVIRAFNNQKREEKRFEKENNNYRHVTTVLFKLMNVSEPMFFFLMNMATVLIYYFASIQLQKGTMEIGQLVAFLEYLFHAMMSVLVFCMVFMMYPRAEVSAKRIQEVLDAKPSIELQKDGALMEPVQTLEFDHVDFGYPDSEEPVLCDICFKAKTGQKVAVVGSTGSGKSSLGKLIPRFYDITGGQIRINDKDIREYNPVSLRDGIGYISQKAHIFSGTIKENIAFSNPNATQEELDAAAATAQAMPFIQDRLQVFEDVISEEGTNLSGGQKQRLSIARALLKKPGLYIFDDSFSALDFATDAKLRKALQPELKNSIFLIVAQRISTILDADLILVLDHGKTVGMGTHQELFASCPIYREIVLSQMSEQEAMHHA